MLHECLSKCKGNQFCGPTLRADNINANAEAMKKRVSLFLEYMTTGSNDFKIPSLFYYSLAVIAVVTSSKLRKRENQMKRQNEKREHSRPSNDFSNKSKEPSVWQRVERNKWRFKLVKNAAYRSE